MTDNSVLSIPILENIDINSIKTKRPGMHKLYGQLLKIIRVSKYNYSAYGWAYLQGKGEPSHAIFLTYRDDKGRSILFKYLIDPYKTDLIKGRADMGEPITMKNWKIRFKKGDIPQAKAEINAWAFDAVLGIAYLLENRLIIDFK